MSTDDMPRTEAGRRLLPVIENMADAAGPSWSPAEGSLRRSILAIEAEAAQGAAPLDKSPFQRVVDDLTGGDGCACHTGTGYNSACRHCQPQMFEGAAPRAEGLDVETALRAIEAMQASSGREIPVGPWISVAVARSILEGRHPILSRLSRPSDERVEEAAEMAADR